MQGTSPVALGALAFLVWISPAHPADKPTDARLQAAFSKAEAAALKLAARCEYDKAAAVSEAFLAVYKNNKRARNFVLVAEQFARHHRSIAELWTLAKEHPDEEIKELARKMTQAQEFGLTAKPQEHQCLFDWAAKHHPPMQELLEDALPMAVKFKWEGVEDAPRAEKQILGFLGSLSRKRKAPIHEDGTGWVAVMTIRKVSPGPGGKSPFALDATFTTQETFGGVRFVAEVHGRGATRKAALKDLARSTVEAVVKELLMEMNTS